MSAHIPIPLRHAVKRSALILVMLLPAPAGCGRSSSTEEVSPTRRDADEHRPKLRNAVSLVDVTDTSSVTFEIPLAPSPGFFFPNVMCGGVALIDVDGDGDLDILFAGGRPGAKGDATRAEPLRLFRQEAPWKFLEITDRSGLKAKHFVMGVAAGDVNNDGHIDLYITCYGPDQLYLGRGNGVFVDVTATCGIANSAWSASACFFDFDRDGRLDLYVTNYVNYFPSKQCFDERRRLDFCGPQSFRPQTDRLFRNVSAKSKDGAGGARFEDVSATSKIATARGPGLGVVAGDFNDDGWPDLYVANDGASNFLWINRRDGTFRDEAALHGIANNRIGASQAGMGLAVADVDGDGRDEILVTHLTGEMNALYSPRKGVWEDTAARSRLGPPGFSQTGFGVAMFDVDHDRDIDVVVANGRVKRWPNYEGPIPESPISKDHWPAYAEANQWFINDGRGRFEPVGASGGWNSRRETSRGLAVGDLDNDGDLDVVIVNVGEKARIYRNDTPKSGRSVTVRAVDPALGGRDVYGAVVTVHSHGKVLRKTVRAGGSYLSSGDPRAHFGLGDVERVDKLTVLWPDGSRETFPGGPTNRVMTLTRKAPAQGDRR